MPWDVSPVSELRTAFVHAVVSLGRPVAVACRDFGVSRKTGHKWLRRRRDAPDQPLADRTRRPHASPGRTPHLLEQAILDVRDRRHWGPRKIHARLAADGLPGLPSVRTVAAVLRRHGRVGAPPPEAAPLQRFERDAPNQLWQCDFKGWLEIDRRRVYPFTVLDDHSRYLLALRPGPDATMARAWDVLWDIFADCGLPEGLLCDNAFGSTTPHVPGVSWFEGRLIRLGIRPLHGRPYHPQTQGKVERLHGTLQREVWPYVRRDTPEHFAADLERWRCEVYNPLRPHEALGDQPPLTRWRPSPRPRPAELPAVAYSAGAAVRKVSTSGDVRWRTYRILAGRGLVGEYVRIEEADGHLAVYYADQRIRRLPLDALRAGVML
jgi:transposase InsO family protein